MPKEIKSYRNVETGSLEKRRVLVVEDDEGLNNLAQKSLRRAGFDTDGVLTGAEALERITENPDLIALIDQQLQDMKGTELIGTLHKNNMHIPFVAMTGHGDESTAIEMMKLGARDYLIKGFDFTDHLPEVFQRVCRELHTEKRLDSAEKSLLQSEERFKLAMEATQDGLWDWNVETDEMYLSPSCGTILGYTSNECQFDINAWNNLIHTDDRVTVFKAHSDCVENHNEAFKVEYRMQVNSGGWIWILGRGKVVTRNGSGRAIRMVGTYTDITRIKLGEAELATQAETLNTIFNSTPSVVVVVNEESRIERINRKGRIFCGKEEDLIGRLGGDAFCCIHSFEGKGCGTTPACSLCSIRTRVEDTFQTGNPHDEEEDELTVLLHDQKTNLNLLISTVLVTVGGIKNVLLTLTNITDLKRAEHERSSLEKQLHQSQKMQSIGTLAGGIAHDFNNILTAILGYTEMAKYESIQDSEINENLGQVIKAGNRAKELVRQILTFSRQSDNERTPLQPGILVEEVIKILRPSLPSSIIINQNVNQPTGLILADPTQLHQILINICTNAYHAMEETGGMLDISLKEIILSEKEVLFDHNIEAGVFVKISIRDTGHGIAKDTINRIFDPYFTTKEIGKGTGMGLSIVQGIVLSYGGFISLDSELGKGTTFHVFLPVIDKEPLSESSIVDEIILGNEKILFVDDEEAIVNMNKKMLEKLGYHVTASMNSLDAWETFQAQPKQFDLVITDQTMPNMTGCDLARNILQIRPDIPIILCTGYSTIINEKEAKAIGISAFVTKPVTNNNLSTLIRTVVDAR